MDVKGFVVQLLDALTSTGQFRNVSLQTEGPIVSGRVYVHGSPDQFLRVYFNEMTGTIAFALVSKQQRIWGIDFDNRRGWHVHPVENPSEHIAIDPLTIPEIVSLLHSVLSSAK
jgi:hypothetical protein